MEKLRTSLEPVKPPASVNSSLSKNLHDVNPPLPMLSEYCVHVVSEDNFPTAAGLESSAPSFVQAIVDLYELPESPTELSNVARQGSARRSLFG